MNLLVNAAQAVADNGKVTIATRLVGDNVVVEIADNGGGIPDDLITKIFDPFFTTKPVGDGTGLGLSTSYGIIEKHGGKILVQSKPNKGATFVVSIPISQTTKKQTIS